MNIIVIPCRILPSRTLQGCEDSNLLRALRDFIDNVRGKENTWPCLCVFLFISHNLTLLNTHVLLSNRRTNQLTNRPANQLNSKLLPSTLTALLRLQIEGVRGIHFIIIATNSPDLKSASGLYILKIWMHPFTNKLGVLRMTDGNCHGVGQIVP